MNAQHTPGPWMIGLEGVNGRIQHIGPIWGYDHDSLELMPGDPDAHLVSAAPELLASCEEALRGLSRMDSDIHAERGTGPYEPDPIIGKVRAAIAKARGTVVDEETK